MSREPPGRVGVESETDLDAAESHEGMRVDAYLDRIGVDPATVDRPDLETLARLQRTHVTSVPFENLAIVGDGPPGTDPDGSPPGVHLSTPHLYEKIVERGRGGYCFELNGLFHWLLAELGYDVDRVPARVMSSGSGSPPANHHPNVVELDRRYVVEVGTGAPMMRRPTPLDGSVVRDDAGVEWRVVESDRPDETHQAQQRGPGDGDEDWTDRYVFTDEPCSLSYFEATNDYLQTAPESPFTGDPVVAISTDDGYRTLSGDTLTEVVGDEERERTVPADEWTTTLSREFGLQVD